MRRHIILPALLAAAIISSAIQAVKTLETSGGHRNLAAQICTAISPRVQVGAMRDAFDQAYAILRISSGSEGNLLVLTDGNAEYGRRPNGDGNFRAETCLVAGRPDFKLVSYFETMPFFGRPWVNQFALTCLFVWLSIFAFSVTSERLVRVVESVFENELWGRTGKPSGRIGAIVESLLKRTTAVNNLRAELEEKKRLKQENFSLAGQNARFEAEGKSVTDLVRQVSHDIRSPLSLLKVFGQRFRGEESAEPFFLAIQKIDGILRDLNKIEGAQIRRSGELAVVECAFQEVISAKSLSWGDGIRATLDFDRSKLNVVSAEHARLARIFENLVSNAHEAMDGKGLISISVRKADEQVEITIKDSGKGIPQEILDRIGREPTTFGKRNGNGIGLFTARQWVEAWGGTFLIQSKEGVGTVVFIRLPRADVSARFVAELPVRPGQEIVVVDDEPEAASLLLRQSGVEGRRFSSIANYADWIEEDSSSESSQEALSVYDLHLGSGSGLDLLRINPRPDLSVLYTDDYLNEEAVALSGELGFPILPKAFLVP